MGILIKTSRMRDASRRRIYERHGAGELTKLAPGVFAPREILEAREPWDRYQLLCAAVAYAYPAYALVGKSAAAIWEIPFGRLPEQVNLARLTGTGGFRNELVRMRSLASIPGQKPQFYHNLHVTPPLQTVLDIGRWETLSDAATAVDYCLREKTFTQGELVEGVSQLRRHKGVGKLADVLLLAHQASGSPRESALRVAMWENGFSAPDLQATIVSESGRFLGRVDALFPEESVLVEYDGRGKYLESTEKALMEERRREKDLLNLGTRMIRVTAETFAGGQWIPDLRRELEFGKGRPLKPQLWSSEGLGWGSWAKKQPRGQAYRIDVGSWGIVPPQTNI